MQTSRKNSFLLRLPLSLREQATNTARNEQVSLNHFISLAVAEKISRMERMAEKSPGLGRLLTTSQGGTHHVV